MEDLLAITLMFGGGTAFLLAVSPIGRALADRIRGKGTDAGDERVRFLQESHDAMFEEVDGLRHEVGDLQERLDFAERLLAQRQDEKLLSDSDVHN